MTSYDVVSTIGQSQPYSTTRVPGLTRRNRDDDAAAA